MSMMGISLLNEISSSFSRHPTNEIMDELRDQVIAALGQTGDNLYLFSDGFPDQFGSENRKKYGSPRLKKLLTELQPLIMLDQQSAIEEAFDLWQGSHEQIDDVLMIGIKL